MFFLFINHTINVWNWYHVSPSDGVAVVIRRVQNSYRVFETISWNFRHLQTYLAIYNVYWSLVILHWTQGEHNHDGKMIQQLLLFLRFTNLKKCVANTIFLSIVSICRLVSGHLLFVFFVRLSFHLYLRVVSFVLYYLLNVL